MCVFNVAYCSSAVDAFVLLILAEMGDCEV